MHNNRHTILSKVLILMMSFLVCLNCAAKKEIKIALNIPVSQSQQGAKVFTGNLCAVSVENESTASSLVQSPVKVPSTFYENAAYGIAAKRPLLKNKALAQSTSGAKVPIYILHEQFLI